MHSRSFAKKGYESILDPYSSRFRFPFCDSRLGNKKARGEKSPIHVDEGPSGRLHGDTGNMKHGCYWQLLNTSVRWVATVTGLEELHTQKLLIPKKISRIPVNGKNSSSQTKHNDFGCHRGR